MSTKIHLLLLLMMFFGTDPIYAHDDPPIMNLALDPDMPDVGESTELVIQLHGSLTGMATVGAKMEAIATHPESGETWTARIPETKTPGTYQATLSFSQYNMWKLQIRVEHDNELDYREYMVHVMKPVPGYHNVLKDETLLEMDKNEWGQPIPPGTVLRWYVISILVMLIIVSLIKRSQETKKHLAKRAKRTTSA